MTLLPPRGEESSLFLDTIKFTGGSPIGPASNVWEEDAGLVRAVGDYFGSWCEGLKAVGIEPPRKIWTLFEDDVVSANPSDKQFFAISLEGNTDPSPAFLRRLDSLSTEVVRYSEARTHPARKLTGEGFDRAGLYFDIEGVEWVSSSHVIIQALVGAGGLGTVYQLELWRTTGNWECRVLKRFALS